MSDSPALIELEDVGRVFANGGADGRPVLSSIRTRIMPGEFVSLVGPSGCGKSTLLRLIAGLDQPDKGRVRWPQGRPDALGYVFQDATLMPWARVFDNVWMPLRLRGVTRAAASPAVREALALVGLEGRAEAYPGELSGGMRMRVSIARALALEPQVLLMDEPFAALDEITRTRLNDDLNRLWAERDLTVIYVTHSVYEAAFLSTRVLVMADRPGPFLEEVPVTAPRLRDDDWRADPAFAALTGRITGALRRAWTRADRTEQGRAGTALRETGHG